MRKKAKTRPKTNGSESRQFILTVIILYAFWLIVSGHFTPKLLVIGFISALIVAWISRALLRLDASDDSDQVYLAFNLPYLKYIRYWIWLLGEIVKSNLYVIKLVLSPKMPIDPRIVTFKKSMANPMAHVTLGNSITLTPGTVTIAIDDDVYYIHAITEQVALDLAPANGQDGDMVRRVAELFGEQTD